MLRILKHLVQGRLPGDLVLGLTERELRRTWIHCSRTLGLEEYNCRPYSLRRGGATSLFRESGSLDTVAERGRWASIPTARRYIDDGIATQASLMLTDSQHSQFTLLAAELQDVVATL